MLRYAAKRAANCSRSTHQQYKSLHLWPAKPLVEAAVYDFQRIPKPQAAGSNPAGGTQVRRTTYIESRSRAATMLRLVPRNCHRLDPKSGGACDLTSLVA